MAVELVPTYGSALSLKNEIVNGGSVLSATSEAPLMRKERLLSPLRSMKWRSTSAGQQKLVFQTTGMVFPGIFALLNCNVAAGKTVVLEGATEQTFNTGHADYAKWNFTTYIQSLRKSLRWYPGAADVIGSNPFANRTLWQITLPASGTLDSDGDGVADPYYEVGVVWLGAYTNLIIGEVEFEHSDPSQNSESGAGAVFFDKRRTFISSVSFTAEGVPEGQSNDLQVLLDDAGKSRHVLFDMWAPTVAQGSKAGGCVYGRLGDRDRYANVSRSTPEYDEIEFELIEARA